MTMIERVAASIVIAQKRGLDRNGVARAAIEAMRDEDAITDDMLEAGQVALHAPENRHGAVLGAVFCAMIDQALKDEA